MADNRGDGFPPRRSECSAAGLACLLLTFASRAARAHRARPTSEQKPPRRVGAWRLAARSTNEPMNPRAKRGLARRAIGEVWPRRIHARQVDGRAAGRCSSSPSSRQPPAPGASPLRRGRSVEPRCAGQRPTAATSRASRPWPRAGAFDRFHDAGASCGLSRRPEAGRRGFRARRVWPYRSYTGKNASRIEVSAIGVTRSPRQWHHRTPLHALRRRRRGRARPMSQLAHLKLLWQGRASSVRVQPCILIGVR
jgi:hypothetical protein